MSGRGWAVVLMFVWMVGAAAADEGWRPHTSAVAAPCNCQETVIVRRPVIETTLREEQYTVLQPTVAWHVQQVDQGRWVTNYVEQPGTERTRLRWVPGGWTTDAQAGQTFWRPGMLRPTKVQQRGPLAPVTVWQPRPVTVQVPLTSYTSAIQTRKVPVQAQRWVEEQQVRRAPGCTCAHQAQAAEEAAPLAPLTPLPRPELRSVEPGRQPAPPPASPPDTPAQSAPRDPPRIRWSDISRVASLVPGAPVGAGR